jgi:peptidoglycan/xylan/chitin deacetylase (PgdA/CDA1 family)
MNRFLKNAALRVAQSAPFHRLLAVLERADCQRTDLVRVLTYHRVAWPEERPSLDPTLISATPAAFEQQIQLLASSYNVISLVELLEARKSGVPLPPRSVLITFDDAYRDFAEHAWPVLQAYNVPATLFVPTGFPDCPERTFWWDRLHQALRCTQRRDQLETPLGPLPLATAVNRKTALRLLKNHVKTLPHQQAMSWLDGVCGELGDEPTEHSVLSWSELGDLSRRGVTLGVHTRNHPLLNRVSPTLARQEVAGALEDLQRETGSAAPALAYPSGALNEAVVQILRREGVRLAFTTERGINDLRKADPLRLRRIHIGRRTTAAVLRAQLLPWSVPLRYLGD